jgi:hypothetical protein
MEDVILKELKILLVLMRLIVWESTLAHMITVMQ